MLYLRVVFRDQSFIYIKCLFATYQRYFHTGTGDLSVTCMCPIESGHSEIDNLTLYPNIFYSLTSIFRHISKCCVGDAAARAASATHRFPENISQIISCHLIFTLDKNELRKLFPRTLLEYTLIFRFINHLITQQKLKWFISLLISKNKMVLEYLWCLLGYLIFVTFFNADFVLAKRVPFMCTQWDWTHSGGNKTILRMTLLTLLMHF